MSETKYERYPCPDCGNTRGIGLWPICPDHGKPYGMMTFVKYWDENVAEEPVWVTSLAQRKRLMKDAHMDYRGIKAGMPGCEF